MTARVRPYRPDAQLAALTARGDSAAFGELVARHTRPLSGVLHRHAWALDLVERDDMRQEALLGYWLACETFDRSWGILFPTYGDKFAARRIMHLFRAAQARKAQLNRDAVSLDAEQPAQDGEQPGTLEETVPAAEYWQPEVMSEIRRDVAKTLGVSQTTVRNWSAGDELARAA
jgi:DNA-directed RNA polymerase specialized sigma24 family protein